MSCLAVVYGTVVGLGLLYILLTPANRAAVHKRKITASGDEKKKKSHEFVACAFLVGL